MRFRVAEASDLDNVYLMGFDTWGAGITKEAYLAECRGSSKYRRGTWYIVEEGGSLLSSLIVYSIDSTNSIFGIGSIATSPQLRGRGYASKLIQEVMDHIRARSPEAKFVLYSDVSSAFYERLGFCKLTKNLQLYERTACMIYPATALLLFESKQLAVPPYF